MSHQHLDGATTPLFGEGAHSDGRDEEEVEVLPHVEQAFHACVFVVNDVVAAVEDPQLQACQYEEYRDGEVSNQRGEETRQFFFVECVHLIF